MRNEGLKRSVKVVEIPQDGEREIKKGVRHVRTNSASSWSLVAIDSSQLFLRAVMYQACCQVLSK